MKFNIDKKSALSIAAVIAVGIVLALLIVFWKGDSTPAPEGGEHAEETAETKAEHGDEKEEGHAEEPGLIEMSPQQIQTAGIATATAGPAAIRTELVLPGEVRFNADRTAHVVPRVAGVVESVAASLGQDVKKGQSLAVIASAELADLRSAALAAGKSLLPAGARSVDGRFHRGACLSVRDGDGREIARGITSYASDEIRAILGCGSDRIEERLGFRGPDELIHRNDLVLL